MVDHLGSIISSTEKGKRMQKTLWNWSKESLICDSYSKNITLKIPKNRLLHLRLLIKVHLHPLQPLNQGQKLLFLHRRSSAPLHATALLNTTAHFSMFLLHFRLTGTHLCRSATADDAKGLHPGLNTLCNTYLQQIHTLQKLILFYLVFPFEIFRF